MKNKKKTVDRHFEVRCMQRLGYIPRRKDLIEAIQNAELEFFERQSNRVTKWLWTDPVHGIECILPYDKERKQIITILFKGSEDERENFRIKKEEESI